MSMREKFNELLREYEQISKINDYPFAKKLFRRLIEDNLTKFNFEDKIQKFDGLAHEKIPLEDYYKEFRKHHDKEEGEYIEVYEGSNNFYKISDIELFLNKFKIIKQNERKIKNAHKNKKIITEKELIERFDDLLNDSYPKFIDTYLPSEILKNIDNVRYRTELSYYIDTLIKDGEIEEINGVYIRKN